MFDQHNSPFFAQFKIPAWCPPNISIGMKNGKTVSYIGDPLNPDGFPFIWRDIDEDLRLEWENETIGKSPTSFSFDIILSPETQKIREKSNGERYLQQYSSASEILSFNDFTSGLKQIGTDYFAPLPPNSHSFIKWTDVEIVAEKTMILGIDAEWCFWATGITDTTIPPFGTPVCGIFLANGYIFFLQDALQLIGTALDFSEMIPYAVGTYNVGDRMFFVEIIDTMNNQNQIWLNGQQLDSGTYHPFIPSSNIPNSILLFSLGDPMIANIYSTGVSKFSIHSNFWEEYVGYQWRYCGIEGSIAKLLAPFALEMDYVKTQVNIIHQSIFVNNFIKDLLDTQLYTASPKISGLALLGSLDKHILIEVLNKCINPNAKQVEEIVKLFAGSTPSSSIYEKDIRPNIWSVRIPITLASDAIWGFSENLNYVWLLNKLKALSTNVFLEWYCSFLEPETWEPLSFVDLVWKPIHNFTTYKYQAFWDDDPVFHWNDGAWDAPSDKVKLSGEPAYLTIPDNWFSGGNLPPWVASANGDDVVDAVQMLDAEGHLRWVGHIHTDGANTQSNMSWYFDPTYGPFDITFWIYSTTTSGPYCDGIEGDIIFKLSGIWGGMVAEDISLGSWQDATLIPPPVPTYTWIKMRILVDQDGGWNNFWINDVYKGKYVCSLVNPYHAVNWLFMVNGPTDFYFYFKPGKVAAIGNDDKYIVTSGAWFYTWIWPAPTWELTPWQSDISLPDTADGYGGYIPSDTTDDAHHGFHLHRDALGGSPTPTVFWEFPEVIHNKDYSITFHVYIDGSANPCLSFFLGNSNNMVLSGVTSPDYWDLNTDSGYIGIAPIVFQGWTKFKIILLRTNYVTVYVDDVLIGTYDYTIGNQTGDSILFRATQEGDAYVWIEHDILALKDT